jgi:hypothetical protein
MNPNTRTKCIETMANAAEHQSYLIRSASLGMGVSTWLRWLGNADVRRHGSEAPPARESRKCPGIGKPASRARNSGMRRQI